MATPVIVKTEDEKKRHAIYTALRPLADLPKVSVYKYNETSIYIESGLIYVPDIDLVWCDVMKHYRVYIYTGDGEGGKVKTKYALLTISSRLIAAGFVTLYQFIYKNRANNKVSANLAQTTLNF